MLDINADSRIYSTLVISAGIFVLVLIGLAIRRHGQKVVNVTQNQANTQQGRVMQTLLAGLAILQSAVVFLGSGKLFPGLAASLGIVVLWPFLAGCVLLAYRGYKTAATSGWIAILVAENILLGRILFGIFG